MRFLAGLSIIAVILLCVSMNPSAAEKDRVVAYYFHGDYRCASCTKIEKYTGEVINDSLPDYLESGDLEYRVINVEEKGNEHFMEDYQLYTKSVVLSLVKGGEEVKYKNLDKIWQYLRNKEKFYRYVSEQIESFLAELDDRDDS